MSIENSFATPPPVKEECKEKQEKKEVCLLIDKMERLFMGEHDRVELLGEPDIEKLFNDLEEELDSQNKTNADHVKRAKRIKTLISDLNNFRETIKIVDVKYSTDKRKKELKELIKLEKLKMSEGENGYYDEKVLDLARLICDNEDLNLDLEGKTTLLAHVLEKYDYNTGVEHSKEMCGMVEDLISFIYDQRENEEYDLDIDSIKEKLEDLRGWTEKDLPKDKFRKDTPEEEGEMIKDIMKFIDDGKSIKFGNFVGSVYNDMKSSNFFELLLKFKSGARLHDIGKINTPLSLVLGKKLSDSQFKKVTFHSSRGKEILDDFGFDKEFGEMALFHHFRKKEHKDRCEEALGKNFSEINIPHHSLIIEFIDQYNAYRSSRSYKKTYSPLRSMLHLVETIENSEMKKKMDTEKDLFKIFLLFIKDSKRA